MSIDNTPEVKGSNAWWYQWTIGLIVPVVLAGFAAYGFFTENAFAIAGSWREIWFIPVHGFQATLMSVAYIGLALGAFAHGYTRWHKTLSIYSEGLLAAGLVPAAVSILWCSWDMLAG